MTASGSSFRRIYLSYSSKLFRLFAMLGVSPQEAEELTQETLLRVYGSLQRGQEISGSYIFTIARHLCFNHSSREKDPTKRTAGVETIDVAEVASPELDPQRALFRGEARRALGRQIRALPDRQRQCLLLRSEGHTYDEIAELLGIGNESVRSHLRAARKRLRESGVAKEFENVS